MDILRQRFEENMERHQGLKWSKIQPRLTAAKLRILKEMERTGGEPDVIGFEKGQFIFCDCAPQSPRRSLCYDEEGNKREGVKGSAVEMAKKMGVEILDPDQYMHLQSLGEFDTKTSSWLKTPDDIRELGGAIYGDRRYNTVFIYHNGATSFYASRGFRGLIRV